MISIEIRVRGLYGGCTSNEYSFNNEQTHFNLMASINNSLQYIAVFYSLKNQSVY